VRGGPPGAGGIIAGLTSQQKQVFEQDLANFAEVNNITPRLNGNPGLIGLGPTFDSNSCSSCHAQPAVGGSSPPANNLFSVFQLHGDQNTMPFFELPNGPSLVARFPFQPDGITPDGTVHRLFVITGRIDAGSCSLAQPDFAGAAAQNNLIFRQTTPTFGGGLMELIQNIDIINNMNSNTSLKQSLGISGHPNYTGQDGTIGRFGWKAQTRSLMMFAGEAYNIEEGVTNEFFSSEGNETPGCVLNPLTEDHTNYNRTTGGTNIFTGDPERFATMSRFFAPPTPATPTQSTINGQTQFDNVGCVLCHTTSFTTPQSSLTALSNVQAILYSDLLVHHMGPCSADNIVQENAQGDEFRTAPLWGVGQRIFFLHDGRTSDIVQAVEDHFCLGNGTYPDSESNAVINNFNTLSPGDQQDLINFLRSL
jgi:CxxC motif-containing protein (DUF1111 family)